MRLDEVRRIDKVPILGSIPLLGQAFRFKSVTRSRTNLAFIITPIAFQAADPEKSVAISERDRASMIGPEHDLADPDLIGPDLRNSLSTGQFQESDKNPVTGHKPRDPKKQNTLQETIPQAQPAKPDDQ